ncbi:Imm21 family immunity protein [Streptomyces sp. NPDC087437]|uniref:Imm21 family immunity protein n=1 Tax=Streptomyces sp. NPDC087437 TaxID=3365789 RepID=UPI0037FEB69A
MRKRLRLPPPLPTWHAPTVSTSPEPRSPSTEDSPPERRAGTACCQPQHLNRDLSVTCLGHLIGWALIVVPESARRHWTGPPPNYPEDEGDYGRACSVEELNGIIEVGPAHAHALVLGDDPAATTFPPRAQPPCPSARRRPRRR